MNVYRLTQPVRFDAPTSWTVQARYAIAQRGQPFEAPAGALAIGLDSPGDGSYLYRLSDGRVGVLDEPPNGCFVPVEDPAVLALAGQVKTLPELLAEHGLGYDPVSRLKPFTLIACPMCRSTEFSSVDLASAWCERCNTRFETRPTCGDPGVVVDAFLDHYHYKYAHYILPRRGLLLTAVLKDFGHGRCTGNHADPPTALRELGCCCGLQVYDWSLYGKTAGYGELHGRRIAGDPEAHKRIRGKGVRSERLPALELLAEGACPEPVEGACPEPVEGERWYLADVLDNDAGPWWPVWWKVKPSPDQGWTVTDRSLCPECLRPAGAGDHRYCRWSDIGWRPEGEAERTTAPG